MMGLGSMKWVLLVAVFCVSARGAIEFKEIGHLGGWPPMSNEEGMSADGRTVVGRSRSATGRIEAFKWRADAAILYMETLNGGPGSDDTITSARANDVSDDGNVIVGERVHQSGLRESVIWINGIPDIYSTEHSSSASAVADEGHVFALTDFAENGGFMKSMTHACYNPLVPGDALLLLTTDYPVPPHSFTGSLPIGISGDGKTIVGTSSIINNRVAVRWVAQVGETETPVQGTQWLVEDFEEYPESAPSYANAASYDGSAIVGSILASGEEGSGWRGAIWRTGDTEWTILQPLPGHVSSQAYDISGDGDIIVGQSETSEGGSVPVYWNNSGEVIDLSEKIKKTEQAGEWELRGASVTNRDGTIVAGWGLNSGRAESWFISGLRDGDPLEAATDHEGGWAQSTWFGFFWRSGKSHVWHAEHGWEFIPKGNSDSVMIYDYGLESWVWNNETVYPHTYKYGDDASWMWYLKGGQPGERWFFHYGKDKWMTEQALSEGGS